MEVIGGLGLFWTLYGIAGLLGFQIINGAYRHHSWTASYIRRRGISWLMIGIPWLVLYFLAHGREISRLAICLLILLCGLPSIAYTIAIDRKYGDMRKDG